MFDDLQPFPYMRMITSLVSVLLILTVSCTGQLKGKVVAIADGDSFTILTDDKKQVKIRLHGIDCPEKKAPFGSQAKAYTSKLIFGKTITVKKTSTDQYGRTVGIAYLPNGKLLNEELLKAGLAWHFKKHDKNPQWSRMERVARQRKLGLWVLADPTPPWEYRYQNKRNNRVKRAKQPAN